MQRREIRYRHGGQQFVGIACVPGGDGAAPPRPGVLVAHDWSGRNATAVDRAARLAEDGCVGFALDMYGDAKVAERVQDKARLMGALREDRVELIARARAAFDAMCELSEVDPARTAAVGFCFGGLCVLDLARSGAPVGGVVSLHGLLDSPPRTCFGEVSARVLVLHGYRDPMVPAADVAGLQAEFAERQVDFQLHSYGRAVHAFTNPAAKVSGTSEYDALTARRALRSTDDFLRDLFGGRASDD